MNGKQAKRARFAARQEMESRGMAPDRKIMKKFARYFYSFINDREAITKYRKEMREKRIAARKARETLPA